MLGGQRGGGVEERLPPGIPPSAPAGRLNRVQGLNVIQPGRKRTAGRVPAVALRCGAMALPSPAPDRTCLVTGASSGIGVEIARLLARRGLGVTLVARREDRLRDLADELAADHDVRAEVLAADLTDADTRTGIVAALDDLGLTVDVLVNNAGFSTTGRIQDADADREVAMVRLDVEAVAGQNSTGWFERSIPAPTGHPITAPAVVKRATKMDTMELACQPRFRRARS